MKKFEQFEITKERIQTIRGGENGGVTTPANAIAITDPLRKKDKK